MEQIDLQSVPADFLPIVQRAADGETIVICENQRPIAEIRPLPQRPTAPRPIGLGIGEGTILPSFYEPLPDEIVRGFYGES
jgi:antitoxin (DNA-binding transcriptional repressor) of toxin-antitoxin stability system